MVFLCQLGYYFGCTPHNNEAQLTPDYYWLLLTGNNMTVVPPTFVHFSIHYYSLRDYQYNMAGRFCENGRTKRGERVAGYMQTQAAADTSSSSCKAAAASSSSRRSSRRANRALAAQNEHTCAHACVVAPHCGRDPFSVVLLLENHLDSAHGADLRPLRLRRLGGITISRLRVMSAATRDASCWTVSTLFAQECAATAHPHVSPFPVGFCGGWRRVRRVAHPFVDACEVEHVLAL